MAADVPLPSTTDLLRALVRIPSRAGEDDLGPIALFLEEWLAARGVAVRTLTSDSGARLGVYAEAVGASPGRWTVLDATLDTAGFGDLATWTFAPTSGALDGGWLHGRGSADSKAAVALFSHLLLEMLGRSDFAGRVGVLFDCDEHSGRFGGAHAFFDRPHEGHPPPRPDGVLIGYPGMDRIVNGCRGFLRCVLAIYGVAAHSGSSRQRGVNAISRAFELGRRLEGLVLPPPTEAFPLPPQLTITGVHGGSRAAFSQVPDLCELRLDMRLTPSFPLEAARRAVEEAVAGFDAESPKVAASAIDWHGGWPAYRLDDEHRLVQAVQQAARDELNAEIPTAVVGPSNIGNYLASLGVPALCGFGVRAEGIHAANERIALDSIEPVYRVYRNALNRLHRA